MALLPCSACGWLAEWLWPRLFVGRTSVGVRGRVWAFEGELVACRRECVDSTVVYS